MRGSRIFRILLLASVWWYAGMTAGWAQESRATLEGRVTDPQGAVIVAATVIVTSDDTNVKQETKTNDQGEWKVPFLNPGHYSLKVAFPGFKTAERKGLTLDTADDKQIDLTLEVGAQSEQVTVTGEAPLIDTTSATSGTVIGPEVMTEIPLLSRVPTLLADLSPGVLLRDQNQNVPRMWSVIAASDIRVNGGRDDRSNEFLLDGMPDVQGSRIAFIPPLDSVEEFRIMTNAYDAQYGRQAGGTINMSVKSGTSKYHGNLYEFNQNNVFNAVLFQTNLANEPKPPIHYNLYGATLGGPVRIPKVYNGKDKTFFFFTFEGTRNQDPRFSIRSVPTEEERNGDFRKSFTSHLVPSNTFPVGPDKRVIDNIKIFDPKTADSRGFRKQFSCNGVLNVICPDRLDPIALKILQFVPLPNKPNDPTGSSVNNYVPRSTRQNKMASVVSRIDHTWNNQHKSFVSFRWNHEDEFSEDFFDNVSTGGFGSRINTGIGLDHVWAFSPSKVLDLRYNLTRWEEPGHSHGTGFDPKTLGFSADLAAKMECLSFPSINLFGGIGGGCGGYNNKTYHNWNASLTRVHGTMSFHYGGEFRILQEADGGFGNQSGRFDFGDAWTRRRHDTGETGFGSSFASFLLGLPTGGHFPRNADRFESMQYYGLFFQNDWRVTPRLTLNMGLRWDYERPFVERYDRKTSNFDPTVLNPVSDSAQAAYAKILATSRNPYIPLLNQLVPAEQFKIYGAQLFAGIGGQARTTVHSDFHEWQPRFGFAYRITPKTVIRGGFGRFVQGSGLKGGQRGFSRTTPFIATQDNFLTIYDTLSKPFQNGILERIGSSLGPLTDLGDGVNWDNQDPGRPYSWEYSLHLQQEYKGWLFEIGYSHNKTYNIYWGLDQNLSSFDLWKQFRQPRFFENDQCKLNNSCKPMDKLMWDEKIPNPFFGLPGVAYGLASNKERNFSDFLRPIKVLGGVGRNSNPWGKNRYDAMEVKIEHRFRQGFSLITAFTWSKLFEDTSFWGPEISGPVIEHKLGGEDRPFKLSVAPIYELPVGRGKKHLGTMPRIADAVLGGWELTGHFTIQSGAPVVFGTDSFYDGKDFHLPRNKRTLDRWFDTSHFAAFPNRKDDISNYPAWTGIFSLPGSNYKPPSPDADPQNGVFNDFGTFIRRYPTRWANVRASRVNELNLGIFKNFRVTERVKLQFRAEAFNAFNHPRLAGPDTNPHSANFGRVAPVQENTPRLVQLALKINF